MIDAIASVFFVEMDDGFRVAISFVAVPACFQALAQIGVVINLAVENNPDGAGFVAEGLMPSGNVNNAEPPHTQPDRAVGVNAVIVRPAMRHHDAHLPHHGRVNARVLTELHDPGDSAHSYVSRWFLGYSSSPPQRLRREK